MTAIVENTKNIIYWPDAAERRLAYLIGSRSVTRSPIVGAMDGSHVRFKTRPGFGDAETFWCRHHTYGTNVMAIVDHLCYFRLVQLGFPHLQSGRMMC